MINKQTYLQSFLESGCQVMVGFLVSLTVWIFIVVPIYHIPVNIQENFEITAIFTITSIIRQFIIRRIHA